MKKKKVLFIASTGGHLNELMQLSPMFNNYNYYIITEKTKSNISLIEKYQRRITQVYRAPDDDKKDSLQKKYSEWRVAAREQLLRYRNGEISGIEFCDWIEKNK